MSKTVKQYLSHTHKLAVHRHYTEGRNVPVRMAKHWGGRVMKRKGVVKMHTVACKRRGFDGTLRSSMSNRRP